ncbi:FGGY family carbohydrate kinase, partial [Bradyrhizobium sp.]|uniref:FGGY family carbohydrate kinase n=1 Tax=Bradyrhizobium sp. TaxID=376 RepID=UPI00391DD624
MTELFVGIDVGTSGVRACAVDARGDIQGAAAMALAAPRQSGNALDQDPELWWQAATAAISKLGEIIDLGAVARIAISSSVPEVPSIAMRATAPRSMISPSLLIAAVAACHH